jgi:hypothetical protein
MSLIRIRWSVQVPDVPFALRGHPGDRDHLGRHRGHHVPLRGDQLAHVHQLALEREQLGQLRLLRVHEDLVLQLVDALVHRGQEREHRVHQRVEQPVQGDQPPVGMHPAERVAGLRDGGHVVSVHADQEALGVEAVHLGHRLAQLAGAVGDDRDEAVVVLDLRPLVELLDVLDRERVNLEHLASTASTSSPVPCRSSQSSRSSFRASSMLGRVSSSSRQFVSNRCPRTAPWCQSRPASRR